MLNKMKKICIFCEAWASGGIESFITNTVLGMDLQALQIDIVAARLADSIFTQRLRARGVRLLALSGDQKRLLNNYRLFVRLLSEERYDVVHLNIFHGLSMVYACLARRAGVPVRIVHGHGTNLRKSLTKPLKLLVHTVSKELLTGAATDCWACSVPAAEFLFSRKTVAAGRFLFIPNGIQIERFRFNAALGKELRHQLCLAESEFVVGHVGRLCYEKNQMFLLDVFSRLVVRRPDSRLLLVGEGEDKTALREKAERLGIADRVIFYGVSDQVERLLWAMDIFIFPSILEGLGIAMIEAQSAGVPAVCSEKIPAEARVLDRVRTLPLAAGAEAWAEAALALAGLPRTGAEADRVRAAGFDVADVAARIEARYMGG